MTLEKPARPRGANYGLLPQLGINFHAGVFDYKKKDENMLLHLYDSVSSCVFFIFAVEPTRPKTQCEHHRDSVETTSPEGVPLLGAYVPQCDDNGEYRSLQVSALF